MASYFDLLDQEELLVRNRLSGLHEERERIHRQIGEAEDRLRQVSITRETLKSLPVGTYASDAPDASGTSKAEAAGPPLSSADASAGPASSGTGPEPVGPLGWEEGRRRMLSLLATAGRAMRVREIASAIGEDVSTPARVETTRGRLKRLATEGHVVEDPVAWFAIAVGRPAGSGGERSGEG